MKVLEGAFERRSRTEGQHTWNAIWIDALERYNLCNIGNAADSWVLLAERMGGKD